MALFILRRLIQSLFVLLAVSVVVFFAVYAVGDPIELLVSPEASQAAREAMIARLGLDLPVWQQYTGFLWRALHGDLGVSFVHGIPAIELIVQRIPATFELVVVAIGLTCVIGIPLGLVAGLYRDEPLGRGIMASSVLGFSLPNFWQGMMLILLFAVWLGWLPATGRGDTVTVLGVRLSILTADGWSHLIMPAINLALANIALVLRLTASGVVEARSQDYVKFARAKGVKPGRIVRRHILRNILIPVVTVIGMEFGTLIAYSTITETVFAWPGMGKLLIDSVHQLDRPVVVAYVMLVTLIFVVINLVVDILYAALDPRVQLVTPLNNRHGSISQSRPHPHRPPLADTPKRASILKKLRSRPTVTGSAIALAVLIILVVFAPYFAPQNPYDLANLSLMDGRLAPRQALMDGSIAWLGTDDQGRDMLSAILYGLRISLMVGLSAVVLATAVGGAVGLVAAYMGGVVDTILMRIVDFILGFPTILVALVLLVVMGRGVDKVILALVLVQWGHYARIMRGRALQERRKEYVEAAANLGFPAWRIMAFHLLPNCLGPVMVFATIQIATAIALEATLSFLGVGVPITEPSLGLLISNGFQYLLSGDYWISLFPGIALLLLILSINIVGDRLRESLDPKR